MNKSALRRKVESTSYWNERPRETKGTGGDNVTQLPPAGANIALALKRAPASSRRKKVSLCQDLNTGP